MTATITPGGCSATAGIRGSTGAVEQCADLVGGFLLARRLAEVHGRGGDTLQGEVAGLGHVPLRVAQAGGASVGQRRRLRRC